MAVEVIVPVGEYLGALPFGDDTDGERGEARFVDTHMISGNLLQLDDAQAELLAFCRQLHLRSEVDEWMSENNTDPSVLAGLLEAGLLRSGDDSDAVRWLADCIVVPWGRSLGWVENGLALMAPSEEVYQVTPVYYWLWTYARTGQSVRAVIEFLREHSGVPDVKTASAADISAALIHLLASGLGRLELPAATPTSAV